MHPTTICPRSFSSVYCTKVAPDLSEAINTNRGVTLTTSSIRRRPNAFNLLHQLEAMQRGGFDNALQNLEALNTTASFAAAYQIGRTEAGAASNLLTAVSESTRDQLKELVRLFGQPRFLLHDGIAAGVFNMTYNGGALSVDESLSLIQAICGGNSSTLGFVLMSFDVQEISMIFKESAHGGDRRKTNQQCLAITSGSHKHIEWNKSRIMLGAITGIERARVNELANPEEDRPLAPHWRATTRNIEASKSIVLKLLDVLQLPEGAPILVVYCMPHRFGEWSQACAQIQLGELLGENKSVRMHYMGILLADDVGTMSSLKSSVAGQLMTKWIPDMVKNKYIASQAAALTKWEDAIGNDKSIKQALQGISEESTSSEPSGSSVVPTESARTLASPDYTGAVDVPNFGTRVNLEKKPMDEFSSGRTIHCQAQLANSDLNIVKDKNDGSLWITNATGSAAELKARELFGFNVGSFAEVVAGDAASVVDSIPWLVTSDLHVVSLVSSAGDGTQTKELMTIADLCCWITRTRGATDGPSGPTPKTFRYTITPRPKVNCFKPKKLEDDPPTSRYSQFGAIFNNFKQLPASSSFGIV
ncbi:unnamed protein product [Durusdinium trenchii]|uniref:Uncharacterized protein n=1 Tax=Durusdinium trenchii TaxID=1381693 RepID=A0ABP0PN78_9DINO